MGGGDLNLKKSWHPSTLRNIERVWKAEKEHTAEQNKIEQLQKELEEERGREEIRQFAEDSGVIGKKSDRLDWMYAGPAAMVDRNEYLLGRQVDKTFDVMDSHAKGLMNDNVANDDSIPWAAADGGSASVSVDLTNKVQEDPLFAIRKKEQQAKKDILRNPVKMKQLQKYLETSVKKSHKKKSKKKKKKSSRSSSDSSSDSERKKKKKKSKHRHRDHSLQMDDEKLRKDENRSSNHRLSHRSNSEGLRRQFKVENNKRNSHDSDNELNYVKRPKRQESSDEDVKPKKFGLIVGHKKRAPSPTGRVDYRKIKMEKTQSVYKPEPRRKLDADEMERRRLEMMKNAKWRDDQRSSNVKRYKEESEKEMEEHAKSNGAKFIAPMLSKAAATGSLESRLKSNKFKIQRSSQELDKNFARR